MRITLFFITSAIVFALGESLTCYECIDQTDLNEKLLGNSSLKSCEQPFSSKDNTKCNDNFYCSKIISSFNGTSFTLRHCLTAPLAGIDLNDLPNIPTIIPVIQKFGTVTAYFCKTDLCNSASLPTTTVSFLILFLLTLFLV